MKKPLPSATRKRAGGTVLLLLVLFASAVSPASSPSRDQDPRHDPGAHGLSGFASPFGVAGFLAFGRRDGEPARGPDQFDDHGAVFGGPVRSTAKVEPEEIAPGLDLEAKNEAMLKLMADCGPLPPKPHTIANAASVGPLVGVIGDSITRQMDEARLRDVSTRWVAYSKCGETTDGAYLSGAVYRIGVAAPGRVVLALGANDFVQTDQQPDPRGVDGRLAYLESVLTLLDPVPCTLALTVPETGRGHEADDPVKALTYAVLAHKVNEFFNHVDRARHPHFHVADWAAFVKAHPNLLYDGVHLTPAGVQERLRFERKALRTYCGPSASADSK